MPKTKRIPGEPPAPELLLAAIDRAYRHRRNTEQPGVSAAAVKEHLGLPHTGATTLRLRPTWQALQADGLIERTRRGSRVSWRLTRTGHGRLATAQRAGKIGSLPESPQHLRWREAHTMAGERIGGFREELRQALDETAGLLDSGHEAPSETWLELQERLNTACGRLGSATYCLREWIEPDDSRADIDEPPYGHGARRETQRWDKR